MDTQSWRTMSRAVELFVVLAGVVFLGSLILRGGSVSIVWILLVPYLLWQSYQAYRRDYADERAELIATRAGYLAHRLTLAAIVLVWALPKRWLSISLPPLHGHARVALLALPMIALVAAGAESLFRRRLGDEREAPGYGWLMLFGIGAALIGGLLWSFHRVSANYNDLAPIPQRVNPKIVR